MQVGLLDILSSTKVCFDSRLTVYFPLRIVLEDLNSLHFFLYANSHFSPRNEYYVSIY